MNLSRYRLNDEKELMFWVNKYPDRFYKFWNAVYAKLDSLKEGEFINLLTSINPVNHELFIKCACMYILEEMRRGNIDASYITAADDYTYFIRMPGTHPTRSSYSSNKCKVP
ncbi:MAG: hypothetical protein RSA44_03430 [Bacteroides sp.]